MNDLIIYGIGIIAVIIVVVMLLKKLDIKITLFAVGIILMYVAVAMGKPIKVEADTGYALINPIVAVVEKFKSSLSSAGLVILILGGYSGYMSAIGANEVTISILTKPLRKVKSTYILVPIVFLLGNLLSLVIPSASNLSIILLATLYPVLKTSGMSTLTAAAVIATTATIMPTPLGADNVAVAQELGMSASQYVFNYHAIVSIPTLLAMAVVHTIWQKYCDKKDGNIVSKEIEVEEIKEIEGGLLYKLVYGILPLLPVIILIATFAINSIFGTKLNLSVEVVSIISLIISIFAELINVKDGKTVLEGTENFFKGMGNAMGIVALLVAASVFVGGLTSIGIIEQLKTTMATMTSVGFILPIIMVALTVVIVMLSGSGTALFYAMVPLMVPLATAAGIPPTALSVPMGLAGNLMRAVSPVAAVVVIVAGATKESPINIVKRTSVPMIFGTVMMLVLSLIIFL